MDKNRGVVRISKSLLHSHLITLWKGRTEGALKNKREKKKNNRLKGIKYSHVYEFIAFYIFI